MSLYDTLNEQSYDKVRALAEQAKAEVAQFVTERAQWGERLTAAVQRAREAETAEGLLKADLEAYAALEKLARDLGFANIASALDALERKQEEAGR